MPDTRAVTQLLGEWRSGDPDALAELTPIVYEELRRLAERCMRRERAGHTLQTTGLVHEAFERLADADVAWQDRAHFFAVAARQMRRILVDYARARRGPRRGGSLPHVTYEDALAHGGAEFDLAVLDDALDRLAEVDARKSDMLVLHYFGGLTYDETAAALGVSAATVDRDLRFAKAWLHHELADD